MSATQTQVGGDHYRSMKIQPVEFIHANGIPYLEGNVIKYVVRHKAKNGKQDLEKAIHYIQMIIEREYPEEKSAGGDGYRMLAAGEIIQDGDEYRTVACCDWMTTNEYQNGNALWVENVGRFRRPIGKATK